MIVNLDSLTSTSIGLTIIIMLGLPLILLPAVVYGRINIMIKAGANENSAAVEYLGSNVEIIPEGERNTWRLSDEGLKDAARAYSGGRPNDAFLHGPTPWSDLYQRYGWQPVQRTLYPLSARILGIKSEPVIITTQEFVNNSTVTATYNAGITQQVEETSSHTWTKGGSLEIGQEITYGLEFEGVGGIGGSTSLSYTASWGTETSKSMTVTVGSSSGVQVKLTPGQAVIAKLSATRGTMDVEVKYRATLDGLAACNYSKTYKGHHFWAYDINECLRAAGLPRTIDSTETIRIGFYSDAKIVVSDKVSDRFLVESDAAFF